MWLPTFVESQLGHRWAVLNLPLQMHPMSLYINIKTLTVEVNDDRGSRMWMFWWEVTSELMALETNLLLETALRTPWWHLSPPLAATSQKLLRNSPGNLTNSLKCQLGLKIPPIQNWLSIHMTWKKLCEGVILSETMFWLVKWVK